jgi:hypothetical protein
MLKRKFAFWLMVKSLKMAVRAARLYTDSVGVQESILRDAMGQSGMFEILSKRG